MAKTAEDLGKERETRVRDAIELRVPDRVPLVPFFLAGVAEDRHLMQEDNIHPNAGAQPVLLDTLWPYLEPLLPSEETP